MSLSKPQNPVFITGEASSAPQSVGMLDANENATRVNQLHGIANNNALGAGIPSQVSNVQVAIANAQAGSSCTVAVLYRVDPNDRNFAGVNIWVKGYQGNSQLVRVASGASSPTKFVLNNTGEIVSFTVQAYGNGGDAPLTGAPTCSGTLPKSVNGGFGSSTVTTPPAPTASTTATSKFWGGHGIENPELVGTTATLSGVPNVVGVCRFTLLASCLVRSATWSQASTGAGHTYSFGIYTAAGDIVLQVNFLSDTVSGQKTSLPASPVQINPGEYYFAWVDESGGFISVKAISLDDQFNQILNFDTIPPLSVATAANHSVAGVLPATLGALTANSLPLSHSIPAVLFTI